MPNESESPAHATDPGSAMSLGQREYVMALHAQLERAQDQRDTAEAVLHKLRVLCQTHRDTIATDDIIRILEGQS